MRSKTKANTTKTKLDLLSPEHAFTALVEAYQVDDPELIKQKIIWRYVKAIFLNVSGYRSDQIATIHDLPHHDAHFKLCDLVIEARRQLTGLR